MVQIVPAILAKTPQQLEEDVKKVNSAPSLEGGWVHIDFADDQFVPNKTVGLGEIERYPLALQKEAHLMVNHPLEWVEGLKKLGFERVVFHFESKDNVEEVIDKIKTAGMEVGVAIKDETSVENLEPFKDKIDLVLIMSVVPGFQGQPFLPSALEKIKELKVKNWPARVSIDGAVRETNAKEIIDAGADQLTVGSFLLKGDIEENVERIWEVIQG